MSVLEAGRQRLAAPEVITHDASIGGFTAFYGSAMAFGPRGDLAIAERNTDTRVRVRPPGGPLGAARRVTGRVSLLEKPVVAADGRVVVTWSRSRDEAGVATARLEGGAFGLPGACRSAVVSPS